MINHVFFLYIYISDVNVNALTHVINQKMLRRYYYFFTQINNVIRFDPNFFPSSQHGRLCIIVWWGHSGSAGNQCCQGSGTSGRGILWKYSRRKNYKTVAFFWATFNVTQPPIYILLYFLLIFYAFTHVYYTWNVYLATWDRRGGCEITNKSFRQSTHVKTFTQQK